MTIDTISNGTLLRFLSQHRRGGTFLVAALLVSVCALLALGAAEHPAAAQSEPATVGQVSGLTATAEDQPPGVVHLAWNAAENAQVHFVLYLEEDDLTAGNYGNLQMRAFNGTEGTIDGLDGGTSYRFIAIGMRWNLGNFVALWGSWSQWAAATPTSGGVPSVAPAAQSEPATVGPVSGLTATAEGQPPGVVHLAWNAAENAQVHFVLYLEEDDLTAGNYGNLQMRAFNGTEGTIDGLPGGVSYHFIVIGMRWNFGNFGDVWGSWSQWAAATPSDAVTQPTIPFTDLEDGAWLERNKPALANQLKALPWIADGVDDAERDSAENLIKAAVWWPKTFTALMQEPWIQDAITRDEATVIEHIYWLTRQYSDEAERLLISEAVVALLDMPFLDSVESPDALAVWDLYQIARTDSNGFLDIMAHPKVSDGITDREAKVVVVLSSAYRYQRASLPVLLDGLDGTGGVYLQERGINLPHSGPVQLTIIRVHDKDTPNMERLEHAVRVIEEFMGEPLPTNYVAWYLDDAARSAGKGYHAGTHITSSLVYDIVDGDAKSRTPMQHIAHEVGHYYFRGNTHQWLDEGPAKFFESISEKERVGRPIAYFRQSCGPAETIQEQEQLRDDIRAGRVAAPDGWTGCDYYLGERFFVDLYLAIGDDAFRPALRRLYLKSQHDDPTDDCKGTDLSLCHVEAAFKTGASDDVVAKVDQVIDRWYYGTAPPQIPGREDLYQPIQPPEHMAYIWWEWDPGRDHFRELATDFTIHNDVGDFSNEHGLHFMVSNSSISDVGFYFGLQTDIRAPEPPHQRGKGAIFSRWGTRDLANARWDETYGWSESAGHEGDFIGVRRSYDWDAGNYRIRIAPDGLDPDGEWFGLWITDLDTGDTTWVGSLKFPLLNGAAQIKPSSYSTLEIYGNPPIRPIDIPQWHVSIKRPLGDNVSSVRGLPGYSTFTGDVLQNSEVRYDPSEDAVHLQVGGTTERRTPATGHVDFKRLVSLADLGRADRLEPEFASQLQALPWIADGIDHSEREAAQMLVDAANHYPDTFRALLQKPWVTDHDLTAYEATAIYGIRWTARHAPVLSERMLQKPWVQDAITRDEATVIEHIYRITRAYDDEASRQRVSGAVISLLGMPFLDSVESADALAVWELQRIARTDRNDFLEIMAHPKVSDGITDQEAKVVAVLTSAYRFKPASLPVLLDGLDGTGGVYLQERSISLPHSGAVQLTIIRILDQVTPSLDYLEHAVRNVEAFIGAPLPTNYVALYFDDATVAGGGYHADTHITSELNHDDVNHPYWQVTPRHIAHEVGHYYWKGDSNRWWLSEGAADLVSFISENTRIARPLEPDREPCPYFDTISQLELASYDLGSPENSCNYSLGQRLFLDLYHALGDAEFRRGFRNLYLSAERGHPAGNCEGDRQGICHVEAAFKAGTSTTVVAKVDQVIDRWYYGTKAGASDPTVATRDEEYSYSISLSDDWVKESEGRYRRASPWSRLRITSLELGSHVALAQYAARVQDGLEEEWWDSLSLFETTSFQKLQIAGQDFYSITYRVQEGPQYCVVDVSELVTVSNALPGSQHGYRVRMWMCEGNAADYNQDRRQTLHSFRIATEPSTYYGQFLSTKDVVIKAKDTVDPDALYAAADIVSTMLSGRRDIDDCMANVGAGLAIIPKDDYVTTLPEFAHLAGTSDFTGRRRDSFAIRGLGAVKSQPVSATSEEQLLGLPTDQYPHNRFPHIGFITVHEFAHGIQNLCFTQNDWEQWEGFYDAASQAGIFPGTHMMHDVYEFFAVLSTAYFEVTDEIGQGAGRDTVARDFPDVFGSLEEIYGGAVLPPEYRERRFR